MFPFRFWSEGSLPYHEWVHLTLVLRQYRVEGWLNGEFVGSASTGRSGKVKTCPYSEQAKNDKDNTHHSFDAYKNNTIMQIGGAKGFKSMVIQSMTKLLNLCSKFCYHNALQVGMIQDFVVFRNIALGRQEINALMNLRPPKPLPTLTKLLEHYSIDSLRVSACIIVFCSLVAQLPLCSAC